MKLEWAHIGILLRSRGYGDEWDTIRSRLSDADSEHVMLMRVSGALVDAATVQVEPYDEAIRALTKERDGYRDQVKDGTAHCIALDELIADQDDKISALTKELDEWKARAVAAESLAFQRGEELAKYSAAKASEVRRG